MAVPDERALRAPQNPQKSSLHACVGCVSLFRARCIASWPFMVPAFPRLLIIGGLLLVTDGRRRKPDLGLGEMVIEEPLARLS